MEKKFIYAYALKNAIEHKGKSNINAVISGLFNHGLKKENIKDSLPKIKEVLKEVNSFSIDKQKKEFEKLKNLIGHRKERQGLPEIPVNGKVITRFSPSPSGPLHIGHILAALPNFLYAEKYKGKFYVRIEDTNPENIYKPAYNMIKEESKWLFKNKAEIIIQSKRMDLYYKYIKKLLNKNSAYVCTCSPEKFKELISKKIPCPCRNLNKKEHLERWDKMLNGEYKQGEAVVRFKSNIQDKNPAMRDFPLARINEKEHPLQKKKYKVWPLMNLAVSVDDIEMNITHIIRGKDHKDNAKRQAMIFKVFNKTPPWTAFIGRLHFKNLELSSTKIKEGIEKGIYSGWDDKRLPTIESLKKQGFKPEQFYKYVEERGISEADKTISKEDFFKAIENLSKR